MRALALAAPDAIMATMRDEPDPSELDLDGFYEQYVKHAQCPASPPCRASARWSCCRSGPRRYPDARNRRSTGAL